ncbi:MSH4 [Symbiodinium natans]|uniref:MSH4 protein n=1 Tax=Symbiodinium natans TaxID=878477 RepID=A0A812J7A0_9DINO|nr:MSH4 [Symbiodinium natans]
MGEKAMAKAAEEDWHVGESVVALIESRAREIGLAAVHRRSMQFEITQFSDTASYNRVVSHCLFQDPARVLVSRSARGTQLLLLLEQAFPERLLCLERRHFDEARGQALLQETCVSGLQAPDLEEKFVASAAFAALWHFLEASNMHLQIPAVLVRFRVASHSMVIDGSTARLLELVRGASEPAKSLLGLFACRTAGGQHLLRQSLLQPSVQLPEIQARQQAVEALLRDEPLFFQLQQLLPALGDLDVLLARLSEPSLGSLGSLGSGSDGCKVAARTALRLRNVLAALPLLADALEAAPKEGLLEELRTLLGHRRFSELCKELDRVLDSEGFSQRSQRGSMAHCALMYAVKSNVSALLDVARQTWSESMAKIQSTFRVLAAKYPDLRLRLEFAEKRGWFLSHEAMGIPEAFLHTSLKKNSKGQRSQRAESTTKDLNQENFKLRQAEAEILKRTAEALGGLLHELRSEATLLHRASQAAAVLDLIAAFAGYALSASCVRRGTQLQGSR